MMVGCLLALGKGTRNEALRVGAALVVVLVAEGSPLGTMTVVATIVPAMELQVAHQAVLVEMIVIRALTAWITLPEMGCIFRLHGTA